MKLRTLLFPLALGFTGTANAEPAAGKDAARIDIAVTRRGFEPASITVPANKPITLVFTRTTDATCAKRVVVSLDDGKQLERDLPLDKPVEVSVTFPRAGKLAYACSMDMVKGVIVVE